MATKIKNINIKAFRGIPYKELPLEKNSLLLIGENGTGKSSIVDAIEFFFTGEISSLKGIKGISLKEVIPHKNYGIDDVKIELTFTGDEKLIRTFSSSPSYPSRFNGYFEIAQKGKFILRRKELLQFIDVRPSERFKAITNLIGIDDLTKIEDELRKARNSLKNEVKQKTKFVDDVISDISNIVGKSINSAEDVLPILNSLLEENDLPIIESFEGVFEHNEKMFRFTKSLNKVDMFLTLQEIIDKSKSSLIIDDLCKRVNDFNIEVSQLLNNNLNNTLSLLETLKAGKNYLKNEKIIEKCPLCQNNVNRDLLLEQIEERYKGLEEITIKFKKIKSFSSELSAEIKSSILDLELIVSKINLFKELRNKKNDLLNEISFLEELKKDLEIVKETDLKISSIDFVKVAKKVNNLLIDIIEKSKLLESEIELSDEDRKFLEFVEKITKATNKIEDLKKYDKDLKNSIKYFEIAEEIYDKFSTLKSKTIQNIFDSIKIDIQKYYSFLHPDDAHRNINLKIEGKGTSAVLEIESFGRAGEDPRSFTSEGHLDTLGLCIFLAFVKKFNQDCSLIILDDIVTTVDSVHRESICRLLFEEFKRKQFIITTHDGLWFKQVISLINACGLSNNFMECRINRWDENNGPSIEPYKFFWERIPERIESGDISCAGNEIRQYLEWVLESICKYTGAGLPLIDRGYTVGELKGPSRSILRKLVKDEEKKGEILDAFKEIDQSIMGNLLSHNNELAANASINDVKRFYESVHKLHNLVSCSSCKRFLTYERNADRMICSKRCSNQVIMETNEL